jgi:PPOX class probable F420-dependent enzyme
MGVEMSSEELETFLNQQHTVTLITLNKDGTPLPTPLWYVNKGPIIYVSTMMTTQKAKNILRDPRVAVQVEDGKHYLELRAVVIKGRAVVVEDPEELAWVRDRMAKKYEAFRPNMQAMPKATRQHYANPRITIKVIPEKIKSWNNAKLRVGTGAAGMQAAGGVSSSLTG